MPATFGENQGSWRRLKVVNKKGPAKIAGPFSPCRFLVIGGLNDPVIDDAVRFVDVLQSAIPQTAHGRIVFLACDVIVSFIQQFQRAVVAAGAVHSGIDRRMIVQIHPK
jgi:hypothetical protein